MANYITLKLKGEKEATKLFAGLFSQFRLAIVRPTLDWLEGELTRAFERVIGPGSPIYYRGGLWHGLQSRLGNDYLQFIETAEHGGFVRAGTYPHHGGGRGGGLERLKTWAEYKLGVNPSASSRIAWFTLQRGTFVNTPYRYPSGKRRYDYPLRVVNIEGKRALQQTADRLGNIMVRYIESKRPPRGAL